jgi:hypothetical protein
MLYARTLSFLALAGLAATASAQVVDINGGTSWSGWQAVGNSQTSGRWVRGAVNRTFDIYSAYFVLDASQAVAGVRLATGVAGNGTSYTGDNAASLFAGSWQAGDRVVGVGIQYTGSTRGTTWFFHRDAGGTNIVPATSFGAGDGAFSHDAGDTSSYIVNISTAAYRGQVRQYSVWNGFSQNGSPQEGNYTIPYGQAPSLAMPTRSFTVLAAGSTSLSTSMQYFVNIDAILRANGGASFGDLDFGPNTRFAFWEGDQTAGWNGTQYTQQSFTIPEIQQRRTFLAGAPRLGAQVVLRHVMPPGLPGHIAGFLYSMPFAGAFPIAIPGFTVDGLVRIDPMNPPILGLQVTDSVTRPSMTLDIPANPAIVGLQVECQSLDLSPSWTLYLAGNDVLITVAAN